jgi:uncharacterized protein (TIGR01777 family)
MAPNRLIIAGGAGALGQGIAQHFAAKGFDITILTRNPRANSAFNQLAWDGKHAEESWGTTLKGAVLLNLAGELVDRVPTEQNIKLLESSRVEPTLALVAAAKRFGAPTIWLQMSTLAIYGDAGDQLLDESSPAADGPRQMAGVAKAWEQAVSGAPAERLAILRTAVVLQKNTPALGRLKTMTKLFLGGRVASGKQWFSWIHFADFVGSIEFVLANSKISGVVHVTSPNPVTNSELMRSLRKQLKRPWTPPTPAILIRIGARLVFKSDPQLALTGRRALPKKLQANGFEFRYPSLEAALRELLSAEALD